MLAKSAARLKHGFDSRSAILLEEGRAGFRTREQLARAKNYRSAKEKQCWSS
jgi:hypothetical protein